MKTRRCVQQTHMPLAECLVNYCKSKLGQGNNCWSIKAFKLAMLMLDETVKST